MQNCVSCRNFMRNPSNTCRHHRKSLPKLKFNKFYSIFWENTGYYIFVFLLFLWVFQFFFPKMKISHQNEFTYLFESLEWRNCLRIFKIYHFLSIMLHINGRRKLHAKKEKLKVVKINTKKYVLFFAPKNDRKSMRERG